MFLSLLIGIIEKEAVIASGLTAMTESPDNQRKSMIRSNTVSSNPFLTSSMSKNNNNSNSNNNSNETNGNDNTTTNPSGDEVTESVYQQYLAKAKVTDLEDISKLQLIYTSGNDNNRRASLSVRGHRILYIIYTYLQSRVIVILIALSSPTMI